MNPISVLLIDNNATFLYYAVRYLNRHEQLEVVDTAQSGAEGLEKARALQPRVILLDLSMPGQSGFDTLPQLKKVASDAQIIVLTSLEHRAYQEAARQRGADGFVSKHRMADELIPEILRIAGRREA